MSGDNRGSIVCVIGTRAQAIKMAPVLCELAARGAPYRLVLTGQHKATMDELLDEFGIRSEPIRLHEGPEVSSVSRAFPWFMRAAARFWRMRHLWRAPHGTTVVVVHGDTFSTLLGAVVGRLAGATVAHVEAGLRSYHLLNPFPEELIRLATFRLAHVAYCPGAWACKNLRRYRTQIVDTGGNTLLDTVRMALAHRPDPTERREPYAVVSIHRFENLYSEARLQTILNLVDRLSEDLDVIFVLHPATRNRLEAVGQFSRWRDNPRVELRPRMTYRPFISLAAGANLVVTDGGSNQEELSYLRIPTVLMRQATERLEGLGDNVLLSEFDEERIEQFVRQALNGAGAETRIVALESEVPSRRLVDHLVGVVG